jgi:mutator protein MutT
MRRPAWFFMRACQKCDSQALFKGLRTEHAHLFTFEENAIFGRCRLLRCRNVFGLAVFLHTERAYHNQQQDKPYNVNVDVMSSVEDMGMKQSTRIEGAIAVLEQSDRLLVTRRSPEIRAGGWWCLPGGGVEPGESHAQAVVREVQEELGLDVQAVEQLWRWTQPSGELFLSYWRVRLIEQKQPIIPNPAEVAEFKWVTIAELRQLYPLLESNYLFLDYYEQNGRSKQAG